MKAEFWLYERARHVYRTCPVCGTSLVFGLLDITVDDSDVPKPLTHDCTSCDLHGAMKVSEVREMFTRSVVRREHLLESDT